MARDGDDFGTYQAFLKTAIRRYWDRKGSSKVTFLALMLATRQAWGVALEKGFSVDSGRKVLMGAGGAAAVAVALRLFLGGPLGLLLTGASAVSLLAVYAKNSEAIWKKVARFYRVIDDFEERYDALATQVEEGKISEEQRELMMEGLMARFLDELDTLPPEEEDEEEEPTEEELEKARTSFASHVARHKEEAEPVEGEDED